MSERGAQRHDGEVIRADTSVEAPAERVWRALTEPHHLAAWFVDRAGGEPVPGTSMVWFWDEFGYELPLEVVDAVPGERLVLRASWGPETTLMEFTLEEEGGSTRVRVVHSGFSARDANYEGTASGWAMALAVMKHYAERHFGRPARQWLLTRSGDWSREEVTPFYRTAAGLARWLGTGSPGGEGDEVRLRLRDGGALSGAVLHHSPGGETCLSWRELDGLLELKQWEDRDGQRKVGLRLLSWSGSDEEPERTARALDGALDRLASELGPDASSAAPRP